MVCVRSGDAGGPGADCACVGDEATDSGSAEGEAVQFELLRDPETETL